MNDIYRPAFGAPINDWHRWFAWRPVNTVDRGWRWLRVVHCRRIHKHNYLPGGPDTWFQYAVAIRARNTHDTPDTATDARLA